MSRPVAVVTGASRGIGKASAIALAGRGFDLVITGRTVRPADAPFEPTGRVSERLPGSLEETAQIIEAAGAAAHTVALDLSDPDRLVPAAEDALRAAGRVDVLLNNAIWTGPGNYTRFLDTDQADVDARIFGNLTAQIRFMRPIVRHMVERGSGIVMNMASGAGYAPPFAQPGEGGWGLAYAVSKAGFQRIAVQLAYEYADDGLLAFNLQPGFVATERVKMVRGPVANVAGGVEPEVVGAAVAHVATHADEFESGSMIQLQEV